MSRSDSPFFTLLDATASERTSALETLGRGLETESSARRLLEEERRDDATLEGGHLLDRASIDLDERLGGIKDFEDGRPCVSSSSESRL